MADYKKDKLNSLPILSPGGTCLRAAHMQGWKGEGVSSERGVATIAAVLAIVILMAIGLSFAFTMRLEEKAAVNFMNSVKANHIAQAGIERAIAELRNHAKNHAYFTIWATIIGYIGNDRYTVTVRDTAGQIYLNQDVAQVAFRLDEMLDALDGITPTLADDIIAHRNTWPDNRFITKEQVKGTVGIGEIRYNRIKDDITVHAWVNPATGRAPVNVNTASRRVLIGALDPLTGVFAAEAAALAGHLIANRPIRTWAEFDVLIDAAVVAGHIGSLDADRIKNNANPNRTKPSPHTTEFSFNSGGYFEIESTGRVYDLAGDFAAERKIGTIVNIFNIWHQTTRADFAGNILLAVDARTRFHRESYYHAAQLAHLLVETEEDSTTYPYFNFSILVSPWQSVGSGGFNDNPFKTPSDDYLRRDDAVFFEAICQWNFEITDAKGLSGGYYDVFAWWFRSFTNSFLVIYDRQIGGGTTSLLAIGWQWWQWWLGGGAWNNLGSLYFPTGTTGSSFIGITAGISVFPFVYTIADAMLLAAVNAPGEAFAGTMTADFSPGGEFLLGTIAWTEVSPPNTDITFDVGIAPFPLPPSGWAGTHSNPAGNPLSGTGTEIHFRACFSRTAELPSPADPPILDDVTITYLPRTRILYWREVTEY